MGYGINADNFFKESIKLGNIEVGKMLELGSQHIRMGVIEKELKILGLIPRGQMFAKEYFTKIGWDHHSVDLNGQGGSKKIDLRKPFPDEYRNFNVVTNFGTSEHVNEQYQVFKNIHDALSVGGIVIHVVPMKDNWIAHPSCHHWYDFEFFENLAKLCNYEIVNRYDDTEYIKTKSHQVYIALKKTDSKFPPSLSGLTSYNKDGNPQVLT